VKGKKIGLEMEGCMIKKETRKERWIDIKLTG
jgi:hypothetical protein